MRTTYPWFVRRDLDGFFGLFVDNLVQLLVITELCVAVTGLTRPFIYSTILPAAALSVLFGNIYYSWQARRIAMRTHRTDVTALPYGINTPSVFAFILFIMMPVYHHYQGQMGAEAAARLAWQAGLVACLGSGLIEFFGAFVAEHLRRHTPRAALLSALAGIAIAFISMDFIFQVFERPLLALIPAGIILIQYFSGVRLPLGLPAGLVALIVGAAIGWAMTGFVRLELFTPLYDSLSPHIQKELGIEIAKMPSIETVRQEIQLSLHLPTFAFGDLTAGLARREVIGYLGIIIPMGLFNLIGSLQNIESAEAEGDSFPTAPSLAVNGLGSMLAATLGSCFPTTIYIGHPGWKRLGARTGYSALNGVVIAILCFGGMISAINVLIPVEAIVGILIWIAVVIGAQAFQAVPRRHAPAVVLGLFPAIAAWGWNIMGRTLQSAGSDIAEVGLAGFRDDLHVGGIIALEHGYILTSMGLAAMGVYLIDRKFRRAALWTFALAVLAFFGLIHAFDPQRIGELIHVGFGTGWRYTLPYALLALILFLLAPRADRMPVPETNDTTD